jgi:hypothetical protein
MTSQSPRIYIYKITFEEVPYYYYGSHKEKKFDEEYWGTPVTHKWCWKLYTPKKQILELFDFTDEGYIEAQKVEGRLIRPVYNTDKWCLNENCLGVFSLEQKRKAAKIGGEKAVEMRVGIFGRTQEEMIETSREAGKKAYELKLGVHSRSKEKIREDGSKGGKILYEMKLGVHNRSPEQMSEDGKKGGSISGTKSYELGIGIHARTKEQMTEDGRKSAETHRKNKTGVFDPERKIHSKGGKSSCSQRWVCTETGFITNAGNLTKYQRKRGIDTSKRKRIS